MLAPGKRKVTSRAVYRSMAVVSLEGGRERRPYPAQCAKWKLSLTMAAEPLIGRLGCLSRVYKAFFALRADLPPFSCRDSLRVALERVHHSHYPANTPDRDKRTHGSIVEDDHGVRYGRA